MPKEERETEKPNNTVKLVEEILSFNKQKQEGKGIKILTPNQMLSRLSISLAQLEAENNSEKLKKKKIKATIIFSLPFKKYGQASIQ